MDSIAPNWLIVFRISTSFLAGLIFLGLIIWGYFKTKNLGYIIIGGANIMHILFQVVKAVSIFAAQATFYQINQVLMYLSSVVFLILVIGLIVLIVKSEKRKI